MVDFNESSMSGYEDEFLGDSDRHYLRRFWLDADVLVKEWAGVLDRSFVINGDDVSIAPAKGVDVRMGGVLFIEEEFQEFKRFALQSGATSFVVIEDVGQQGWKDLADHSFFRFCYPLDATWDEIANSCAISDDIFVRPIRAYFVVTDNGRIGKYANNDVDKPYDLVFIDAGICGLSEY